MTKIGLEMAYNLRNGLTRRKGNTRTTLSHLYLFGHQIATWDREARILTINHCGYITNTTFDRLNSLLFVFGVGRVYRHKGVPYHERNGVITEFYSPIDIKV